MLYKKLTTKWDVGLYRKVDPFVDCKSVIGNFQAAFNGSTMIRHDFKRIDGECVFAEKDHDYQAQEILGNWALNEWKPHDA